MLAGQARIRETAHLIRVADAKSGYGRNTRHCTVPNPQGDRWTGTAFQPVRPVYLGSDAVMNRFLKENPNDEKLSGKRAFDSPRSADTLASILKEEPDPSPIPAVVG